MSLLETVRTALITAGVATSGSGSAWPCYIGYAPDDQDQLISLEFTGGFPQDTQQGENTIETFQLRVRAGYLLHSTCETKCRAAFNALENADLTGVNLIQALNSGPLSFLDTKNRPNMTVNFRVVRARV